METLTTIATRRSVRVFTTDQIKDFELNAVLQSAWAAPIGHNEYKDLHISVVQNKKLLDDFAAYCGKEFNNPKYNPFFNASTRIVVSAKPKADGQLVYIADVACVMENMQLSATDLGLGSTYLWALLNRIPQSPDFIKALNLPEGFKAISAMPLGYPLKALPLRSLDDIQNEKITTTIIK